MSILEATHRGPVCSVAGIHAGTAAAEGEAARTGTTNRTAPVAAAGTDIVERTNAVVADARHGQLKRRGKGTGTIITAPT